jgi:hypothetical protein
MSIEWYYNADQQDLGVLFTAPRPLPGELVGYRAGTGFAVYLVKPEFRDEAYRLDGRLLRPATTATWRELCDELLNAQGFNRADYEKALPAELVQSAVENAVSASAICIDVDWVETFAPSGYVS